MTKLAIVWFACVCIAVISSLLTVYSLTICCSVSHQSACLSFSHLRRPIYCISVVKYYGNYSGFGELCSLYLPYQCLFSLVPFFADSLHLIFVHIYARVLKCEGVLISEFKHMSLNARKYGIHVP